MTTVEVVTTRALCIDGRRVEIGAARVLSQTAAWLLIDSGKARLQNPADQPLIDGAALAETLASLGAVSAEAVG